MLNYIISFLISMNAYTSFRMRDLILNDDYKICIIGDTGTGSSKHKLMASMLSKEKCNQVRVLGDVIYPSGLKDEFDNQYNQKFYSPFKQVIESKPFPTFHIITGNHDYKQDENVWTKLHNKFNYLFSPAMNFVETYHQGSICFFNLDTTPIEYFKLASAYQQYKWIKNQINSQSNCKIKLAFGHHPYLSSGYHGDASLPLKIFFNHTIVGKVDAYFSGHDHNLAHEGKVDGTDFFVSGSFSKSRPIQKKTAVFATKKNGYIIMKINQKSDLYFIDLNFKVLESDKMKSVYKYRISKKIKSQ